MKVIFQSHSTRDLLHNWLGNSLEIIAGFFFHHRGSAIQKSLEGVLRSLILQILAPIRDPFVKRHQPILEEYVSIKEQLGRHKTTLLRAKDMMSSTVRMLEGVREELSRLRLNKRNIHYSSADKTLELEARQQVLETEEAGHREEILKLERQIHSIALGLKILEEQSKRSDSNPESKFLSDVAQRFRDTSGSSDRLIPRLEGILRQLLGQRIMAIDLVLFFDALDEFDGHDETIGRFMKSLINGSAGSKTRVKICMSSRPTPALQAHFGPYPGFAIQNHTKPDIQEYATRSVPVSPGIRGPDELVRQLVPTIIERANGVFLWVKLAIKVLLETAEIPGSASLSVLEKKLEELPDDLLKFYELIVGRITRANRLRTFALLELLIHHKGPSATASQIRDAVLVSDCETFDEAVDVLDGLDTPEENKGAEAHDESRIRDDIHTWSGGLVEIKLQHGVARPQLMHQTVAEFVMGPWFKKLVVGNHLASLLQENGHSFYVKHWIAERALTARKLSPPVERSLLGEGSVGHLGSYIDMDWGWKCISSDRLSHWANLLTSYENAPWAVQQRNKMRELAYHAVQSELTTGKSQYKYLSSVRYEALHLFGNSSINDNWTDLFFLFITSFSLTLCLRDGLQQIKNALTQSSETRWPLLSSLIFFPPMGKFEPRFLKTIQLLFDAGFKMRLDPDFFPRILTELWARRISSDGSEAFDSRLPSSALIELANLALTHGQDPNINLTLFSSMGINKCRPLHIAPPPIAKMLLQHDANPLLAVYTPSSSLHLRPIHWIFQHPKEFPESSRLECLQRYEMCTMLANSGGITAGIDYDAGIEESLGEFEAQGYDTMVIREQLACAGVYAKWDSIPGRLRHWWHGKFRSVRRRER